jgi:hypothetical protein
MPAVFPATMRALVLLGITALFPLIAAASSLSDISETANNPRWLNLLQFHSSDWNRRLASEVDSSAFFFADDGKTNPESELRASIKQLSSNPSLQCRFPARAKWLYELGLLAELNIGPTDCPELHQWLKRFNAESISLIFPAAYLNSPSSMFGHTFLRINQQGQNESNRLMAETINFAANVNHEDSEFLFAYRGLFGGYPGVITVKPYYEKAKEYSEIENRDIWEYQLDFSPEEIRWLLLHTWELLPIKFDYYFFDENCAYRILTLLDVARPSLNLTKQFYSYAIPSDTVRSINDSGLIKNVLYRPSMATQLRHKVAHLPEALQSLAVDMAQPGVDFNRVDMVALSEEDRAAVLEVSFSHLRYQVQQQKFPRESDYTDHSLALLKQRSLLPPVSPYPPVPVPSVRDDQGHKTFQISVSQGNVDHVQTTRFSFRPAYHDLNDPLPGYPEGAQIKFLETEIDYRETGSLRVASFTGLNITSLSVRDRFFKPLSWRVDVGAYRKHVVDRGEPLTPMLTIGAGHSYSIVGQQVYALIEARHEQHHRLPSNYSTGLGVNMGWLAHQGRWQQHLSLSLREGLLGYQHYDNELSWQLNYHLHPNLSLSGKLQVNHTEGEYFRQHQLGIEWRF